MGGHVGGQVASQLAVATIAEVLAQRTRPPSPANEDDPLVTAIRAPTRRCSPRPRPIPTCTTWARRWSAIRADGDLLHLCHVGDSRIYRLRSGSSSR